MEVLVRCTCRGERRSTRRSPTRPRPVRGASVCARPARASPVVGVNGFHGSGPRGLVLPPGDGYAYPGAIWGPDSCGASSEGWDLARPQRAVLRLAGRACWVCRDLLRRSCTRTRKASLPEADGGLWSATARVVAGIKRWATPHNAPRAEADRTGKLSAGRGCQGPQGGVMIPARLSKVERPLERVERLWAVLVVLDL